MTASRALFVLTLAAALAGACFGPAEARQPRASAQAASTQADPELAALKAQRAELAAQVKARKAAQQKAKLRQQIADLQDKLEG